MPDDDHADGRRCPYPGDVCENPRFVKVRPHSKQPVGTWKSQRDRYAWTDDELVQHREQGGNAHIVTGDGLLVIDIDDPPVPDCIDSLPDTFTVKTPGGGLHRYYRCDYGETHAFPWGEIRGERALVATPGNVHPSGGEYYVLWDRDIKGVPTPLMADRAQDAIDLRDDADPDADGPVDVADLPEPDAESAPTPRDVAQRYDWMQSYPDPDREDRSSFDWAVCCTMIRYGVPKRAVEKFLDQPGSKVRERGSLDYGNTWERARREVGVEAGTYSLSDNASADNERG